MFPHITCLMIRWWRMVHLFTMQECKIQIGYLKLSWVDCYNIYQSIWWIVTYSTISRFITIYYSLSKFLNINLVSIFHYEILINIDDQLVLRKELFKKIIHKGYLILINLFRWLVFFEAIKWQSKRVLKQGIRNIDLRWLMWQEINRHVFLLNSFETFF